MQPDPLANALAAACSGSPIEAQVDELVRRMEAGELPPPPPWASYSVEGDVAWVEFPPRITPRELPLLAAIVRDLSERWQS